MKRSVTWRAGAMVVAALLSTAPEVAGQRAGAAPPSTATPPSGATRTTTDHLQIATSVSAAVVEPGKPFSLIVDVRPRDRMHVYAPGATGYKIVTLTLDANPLIVAKPLKYPESELYAFEPLNERVPVFQKPFRLIQPLTLAAAGPQASLGTLTNLTIKARLDYQACDDRICFAPKSVPLSFTVKLR